jgi:hypothetical protein
MKRLEKNRQEPIDNTDRFDSYLISIKRILFLIDLMNGMIFIPVQMKYLFRRNGLVG